MSEKKECNHEFGNWDNTLIRFQVIPQKGQDILLVKCYLCKIQLWNRSMSEKKCGHKCLKFDPDNMFDCCICTNDTVTCEICLEGERRT
jgi:hypothetical protein